MTGRRRAAALAAVAAAVLAVLSAAVTSRAAAIVSAHRDGLLASVSSFIGRPVLAESLTVSWWPLAVVAREVQIPDESPYGPGDLAHAEEASFEIGLLPLLRGRVVVTDVRLQAPVVRVVRGADGGWNLARRSPAEPAAPRDALGDLPRPSIVVDTVRVRNARLSYRDRSIPGLGEIEVKAVNLRMRHAGGRLIVDFRGQALGGPEENVSGVMRIPEAGAPDGDQARLEIEGTGLQAARLHEVLGVLRGRLPFALVLGGEVAVRATSAMPATWPPGEASIDLSIDARHASIGAAAGWIEKRVGAQLEMAMALRAGRFGLAVERAALDLAGAQLLAEAEAGASGGEAGQRPLRLALTGLDVASLGQWVPALADLRPSGRAELHGRLAPGPDSMAAEVSLETGRLDLTAEDRPVEIGAMGLRLTSSGDGSGLSGTARLDDLRAEQGSLARIDASLEGPLARPLLLRIDAERGRIAQAPVERVAVECLVLEDGAEVRALRVVGLGGSIAARGRVDRARDGSFRFALEPQWSDLDLDAVLGLGGAAGLGRGRLSGRATLESTGSDLASVGEQLAGTFELTLAQGALADLNLAGATLSNLRGVPRLREAVQRRAEERIPGLLSRTSEIVALSARGAIAARRVSVEELSLQSQDYVLDAHGQVGFDGEVRLAGALALGQQASESLIAEAGPLAILAPSDGRLRIPVTVQGTYPRLASAPTSDFAARIMAQAVVAPSSERGGDLLRRLFGGRGSRTD